MSSQVLILRDLFDRTANLIKQSHFLFGHTTCCLQNFYWYFSLWLCFYCWKSATIKMHRGLLYSTSSCWISKVSNIWFSYTCILWHWLYYTQDVDYQMFWDEVHDLRQSGPNCIRHVLTLILEEKVETQFLVSIIKQSLQFSEFDVKEKPPQRKTFAKWCLRLDFGCMESEEIFASLESDSIHYIKWLANTTHKWYFKLFILVNIRIISCLPSNPVVSPFYSQQMKRKLFHILDVFMFTTGIILVKIELWKQINVKNTWGLCFDISKAKVFFIRQKLVTPVVLWRGRGGKECESSEYEIFTRFWIWIWMW